MKKLPPLSSHISALSPADSSCQSPCCTSYNLGEPLVISPTRHPMRVLLIVSASPFSSLLPPSLWRIFGPKASVMRLLCLFSSRVAYGQSHCWWPTPRHMYQTTGSWDSLVWWPCVRHWKHRSFNSVCFTGHVVLSALFLRGSALTQLFSSPLPSWWWYLLLSLSSPVFDTGPCGCLIILACLCPSAGCPHPAEGLFCPPPGCPRHPTVALSETFLFAPLHALLPSVQWPHPPVQDEPT